MFNSPKAQDAALTKRCIGAIKSGSKSQDTFVQQKSDDTNVYNIELPPP
jgi:hypothetical protein